LSTVLVTGGTGFIAGHTILQLLAAGHRVRTTLRGAQRERPLPAMFKDAALTIHVADLLDDAGWPQAVSGCDYVLDWPHPSRSACPLTRTI